MTSSTEAQRHHHRLRQWARHGWLLVILIALSGCAQSAIPTTIDQEKEAPMAQTKPLQDGEAAAEEVAARLDGIAKESNPNGSPPLPPPTEKVMPPGVTLPASDFVQRALRLITHLKSPRDTRPDQVGLALGLPIAFDGSEHRAWGALADGGTYGVWVNDLYHEHPDDWTVGLSLSTTISATCPWPLEVLGQRLASLGFSAKEWRDRVGRERITYLKHDTETVVSVMANVDRTDGERGQACVTALRIDTDTQGSGNE